MKLEWDEAKRQRTLEARGADFADVAHLDWDMALTRDEYDWEGDEVRHVSIARLGTDGRLHVVVWCIRGDALWVISLGGRSRRRRGPVSDTAKGADPKRYADEDGEVEDLDEAWFTQARRGRPPLPEEARKRRVNLMLDPDVVDRLRAEGGMSGRVNSLLREQLGLDR